LNGLADEIVANFRENFSKLQCLGLMKPSKRRSALGNLLDALGIRAGFIDGAPVKSTSASLGIVESSPRWIELATSLRTELPLLKLIVLTSQTAELRPVEIRAKLRNAIFLTLPVTVLSGLRRPD
jgi:hypothetical protein